MTPSRNASGASGRSKRRLQRCLIGRTPAKPIDAEGCGDARIGRGIPDRDVDAVEDAAQHIRPRAQQSIEPHARIRLLDFDRIGRRNRGDAIGELQPGFQEPDRAIIFDPVNGEGFGRQSDIAQHLPRKLPLIGEIVNGHDRAWPRPLAVVQKGVGQSGLPIVGVHDIGHKCRDGALADFGGGSPQRRETNGVVGPVGAVRRDIGVSGTRKKMRRVEYEQVKVGRGTAENTRGSPVKFRQAKHFVRLTQRVQHIRISRHHGARLDPFRLQSLRQRAGHISEAAGLDEGIDLRGDRKHAKGLHADSLSIIGWVIRQMPCSVRRNRLASRSGSSPTTSPSGIRTPRSITTFFNRVPRAAST